jgi:hypothetical protein
MVASQVQDLPTELERLTGVSSGGGTRTLGLPIPEPLWAAAAELARRQGFSGLQRPCIWPGDSTAEFDAVGDRRGNRGRDSSGFQRTDTPGGTRGGIL